MPTVREVLKARIDRLQERKARLLADVQAVQAQIEALRAERDLLTLEDDAKLARLQALLVIKAED